MASRRSLGRRGRGRRRPGNPGAPDRGGSRLPRQPGWRPASRRDHGGREPAQSTQPAGRRHHLHPSRRRGRHQGLRQLRRRCSVGRHHLPGAKGDGWGRSPGGVHRGRHGDLRHPRHPGGRDRAHAGVPSRLPVRRRRTDLVGSLRPRGLLRPPHAGGRSDDGALCRTALPECPLRPRIQPRRLPLGRRRQKLDRPGEVPGRRRRARAQRGPHAGVSRRGRHGSLCGFPVHPRTDRQLDRIATLDGRFDRRWSDVLRAEAGPGEDDGRGDAPGEGGDTAFSGRFLDHARGGP